MNDPSQMMTLNYGIWTAPPPPEESIAFHNPRPVFTSGAIPGGRVGNWKRKKPAGDKRKNNPSILPSTAPGATGPVTGGVVGSSVYQPPTLKELQSQNRAKARRFYPNNKKKFARFAPFAPRNTTSFIIRAKKSGGIASLVSPCPVTPAILPTPKFSPSREGLVDMAKEEWGVDGYGSMKGLIRLRSPARADDFAADEENLDDSGSSESDFEEHLEVERRLDHDLSRFEMVYPNHGDDPAAPASTYDLENRVDDQDTHIAHLEEENLTLKERLFIMEREMGELRRRLQLLEDCHRTRHGHNNGNGDDMNNEEDNDNVNNNSVVNNGNREAGYDEGSENGDVCSEKSVGDYEEVDGIVNNNGGSMTPMHE